MAGVDDANRALAFEFLVWMRDVRRRSESACYDYGSRIDRFLTHVGAVPLGHVDVGVLESWVSRTRYGRARGTAGKPASQAKDVAVLRALFGYLHARGRIERNPALLLGTPKVSNTLPKPVPDGVWMRLWGSDVLPDEARVVLGLGFFVGLRREEITSLSPAQFSIPAQRIMSFVRKGGIEDATPYGEMVGVFADHLPYLLGPDGADSFLGPLHRMIEGRLGRPRLLDWRERREPGSASTGKHQLGEHDLSPEWVNVKLRNWLRWAGLPQTAFSPHQLRHACATHLVAVGVPIHLVSRMLCHSNIQITMRYVRAGAAEMGEWRRQQSRGAERLSDVFNRHGR